MRFVRQLKQELLGPDFDVDPYPAYHRLRAEAPVHRVRIRDGLSCWWISRYDDARAALADPRLSRDPRVAVAAWRAADRGRRLEDEAALDVHLLTREPPEHTRLRGLISGAFSTRRVDALRPRVQEIADALLDAFAARGTADVIGEFAYPLAAAVIGEILGVPAGDLGLFRQWTSNAVPGAPAPAPGDYLRDLLHAKRRAPGDDLISALARSDADEAELLSMIFLLVIAGHEGSVALLGNALIALLTHPGQLDLVRADPSRVDAAIEEVLRYDGPMEVAAWRFATEDVEIGGTVVPAGEPVVISLAAAHRDPARYPDPDAFRITRDDAPHLGFGRGVHYCTGARLARLEGAIGLATLLRLPDLALAAPVADLPRQPSFVVRGLHALPVTFTART
jgi:cytochrome P450